MTVGFYHAAKQHTDHVVCALRLLRSVRQAMPGVEVVQFTTKESVRVSGVDRVQVFDDGPVALSVLEAYASCSGDWVFVDTDVIVQRDVRHVFDQLFDVAVADREGTLLEHEIGRKFMARMPYNKGAVFSRSPEFWKECVHQIRQYKDKLQDWMGDQQAMNEVIASGLFDVCVLPNLYNYPPKSKYENVSDKAILHFKGPRKAWMLERAA